MGHSAFCIGSTKSSRPSIASIAGEPGRNKSYPAPPIDRRT
jgi:hypothetical protein